MITKRMARPGSRGELHAATHPSHYTKESTMRLKAIFIALIAMVVMGISVSTASANVHQAHKGACARGGDNISVNVHDFAANGVVGQFGSAMGIKSFNGSVTKQVISQLVIGKVAVSVTTKNHGCDGSGGVFGAGGRALFKGEHVAVKVPASIGKSACAHPGEKGCVPKEITVTQGFPTSCWNLNTGKIRVVIWVHKSHKKHKAKKKAVPPPPSCTAGFTKSPSSNNQCVQIVTEGPKTSGAGNCNSNNSGNLSGVGEAQGSCNVVVVNCQGTGSCAPETTNICTAAGSGGTGTTGGTGGTGIAEACKEEVVVIPPCGCEPPPPPPPPCETCECKETCKPPPSPPKILSMTMLNDVPIGLTSPSFEVTANLPNGDGGKIVISPEFGRMNPRDNPTTGTKTFSVPGGTATEKLTYEPPTEVPGGAGEDRITVTVIDTVTDLEVEKYTQFKIEPEPVNPS